ncbi:hypothetical protein [Streptomyces acidiscabies]|uniref:hypothetical protein n=1 Tax=Streptomyces acidiscabies TaxID=42234 RepID=UPI0038F74A94
MEFERRDALAQIERYRADSKSESGPGDAALIDAIPQLGLRFAQLPDNLKRDIFDAFQLRVRYDGRDRGTRLQATITADAVPDLGRVGERAAAIGGR